MVCVLLNSWDKTPIDLFASEVRGQNTQMRENDLEWLMSQHVRAQYIITFQLYSPHPYANRFTPIGTMGNEGQRRISYVRGKRTHDPALCAKLWREIKLCS